MYNVRPYTPSDRHLWDSFVENSKNGTFLFARDYMEYHHDRFDDASCLAEVPGGEIVALFPANRTGSRLVSHGGLSYGGMVSDISMTTTRALDVFAVWLDYWRGQKIEEIIYKTVPSIYCRAPSDEDRYALYRHGAELCRRDVLSVIDLARPGPVQGRRLRGAKKAAGHGLEVRESGDLAAFWPILEENLDSRHAVKPVHSVVEMELLQRRFPQNIRLFAVFHGARMCAGSLLYMAAPAVHAQYIASTPEARDIGGLDLLFTSLADSFGPTGGFLDFGSSNEDDGRYLNRGLADFKEGFGARAVCHDFYRLSLADS